MIVSVGWIRSPMSVCRMPVAPSIGDRNVVKIQLRRAATDQRLVGLHRGRVLRDSATSGERLVAGRSNLPFYPKRLIARQIRIPPGREGRCSLANWPCACARAALGRDSGLLWRGCRLFLTAWPSSEIEPPASTLRRLALDRGGTQGLNGSNAPGRRSARRAATAPAR